jgi:Fe2+ transport system protein FeoA/predicted transcriptional regulator
MVKKEVNWMEILMEDILRLAKEKESPTISEIIQDSKVQREDVEKAIKELEKKGLVTFKNNRIILTEEGDKSASIIYNYHITVEKLFGHTVAHSFEHLDKDKIKLLKNEIGKTKPLRDFSENEEGKIISFKIENPKVIARLMGLGIIPGASFKVIKVRRDAIILNIERRIVILDTELTDKILGESQSEYTFSRPA